MKRVTSTIDPVTDALLTKIAAIGMSARTKSDVVSAIIKQFIEENGKEIIKNGAIISELANPLVESTIVNSNGKPIAEGSIEYAEIIRVSQHVNDNLIKWLCSDPNKRHPGSSLYC